MISRRLLRIKVLHILYSYINSSEDSIKKYEKDLDFSIEKSYDLYHLFFILLIDVKEYALNRIELAKNKHVPSKKDLNPNLRFIENKAISQIENSSRLMSHAENNKLNWVKHPELIKNVYESLLNSVAYDEYMNSTDCSFKADKEFVILFFSDYLVNSDLLYQVLEEHSIFWNDDIEFVLGMNIKTIEKTKEKDERVSVFNLFKNDEDREFAKKLFRLVSVKHSEYSQLIQKNIKNWDVDRIAQMDLLVMEMAVTEILHFPSIPVKVSFNEYIELAKFYSTDKSSYFINGVLDKIINQLKEDGRIIKAGRGLKE